MNIIIIIAIAIIIGGPAYVVGYTNGYWDGRMEERVI